MSRETIETKITKLFNIKYPIILAGMNKASGPELAAAVSNAGGLGVIGGILMTPKMLKKQIHYLKKNLNDKTLPFGIDLALPKVGGGARKTNYDYTKGKLNELIDVIIEGGAKLFVSAIGVPPKYIVDKLHKNGIICMNMIGAPKHVKYALASGADILCCQGSEGGGHTGEIATTVLLPKICQMVKEKNLRSSFTGQKIHVIGAGGIYNGSGLAMALNFGCEGVWIGTRFVASKESGASLLHKQAIIKANASDTYRTEVFSGRPMRVIKNAYADLWKKKPGELQKLLDQGIVPLKKDMKNPETLKMLTDVHLSGQVAGNIDEILSAKDIIISMMDEAIDCLKNNYKKITPLSKL